MRIPYSQRQHHLIRQIERTLRRSDPQLTAMLTIFARLYGGESLASPEQQTPGRRMAGLRPAVSVLSASSCVRELSRAARAVQRVMRGAPGAAQRGGTRIA